MRYKLYFHHSFPKSTKKKVIPEKHDLPVPKKYVFRVQNAHVGRARHQNNYFWSVLDPCIIVQNFSPIGQL